MCPVQWWPDRSASGTWFGSMAATRNYFWLSDERQPAVRTQLKFPSAGSVSEHSHRTNHRNSNYSMQVWFEWILENVALDLRSLSLHCWMILRKCLAFPTFWGRWICPRCNVLPSTVLCLIRWGTRKRWHWMHLHRLLLHSNRRYLNPWCNTCQRTSFYVEFHRRMLHSADSARFGGRRGGFPSFVNFLLAIYLLITNREMGVGELNGHIPEGYEQICWELCMPGHKKKLNCREICLSIIWKTDIILKTRPLERQYESYEYSDEYPYGECIWISIMSNLQIRY